MPIYVEDHIGQEIHIAFNRNNSPVSSARAFLLRDGSYEVNMLPCQAWRGGVFVYIPPTPRRTDQYMLVLVVYHEDGIKARYSFELYGERVAFGDRPFRLVHPRGKKEREDAI